MGRTRSAIAARTSVDKLVEVALEAYGFTVTEEEQPQFDDFYDAVNFCRPHCEELGGDEGSDGWYVFQTGEWVVLGDLGAALLRDEDAIEAISAEVGELDPYVEYACFGWYAGGRMKRRLVVEDGEYLAEGLPVPAERGQHVDDFDEEECERLWTSYKLPTFEHDPPEGPFRCIAVQRKG